MIYPRLGTYKNPGPNNRGRATLSIIYGYVEIFLQAHLTGHSHALNNHQQLLLAQGQKPNSTACHLKSSPIYLSSLFLFPLNLTHSPSDHSQVCLNL